MSPFIFGIASALWLGILTSISPCPLASNIAAVSFIGKKIDSPKKVFLSGILYSTGRSLSYLVLGVIIVAGLMSVPGVANFLQAYMNKILGPVLIIVGLSLLQVLKFNFSTSISNEKAQERAEKGGLWGAFLLGMMFALAFCPVSAALFFGSLIPLSMKVNSKIILPLVYGIGTALPVLVMAILIAMGANYVAKAYNILTYIEKWARRVTGVIFLLAGLYYSLIYIFGFSI